MPATSTARSRVRSGFRGVDILNATIAELSAPTDPSLPSLKNATAVLLTGGSAGAFGVHNNIDRVAAALAPIPVKGIADSGWVPFGIATLGPHSYDPRPDASGVRLHQRQTGRFLHRRQPDPSRRLRGTNFDTSRRRCSFTPTSATRRCSAWSVCWRRRRRRPRRSTPTCMRRKFGRRWRPFRPVRRPTLSATRCCSSTSFAATKAGSRTLRATLHAWYFGTTDAPLTAAAPPPETTAAAK